MVHRHLEGEPTGIKRKSISTIRFSVILDYWSVDIYLITPWSRVLLEKLTGSQLVKKFPTLYGTQRFITAFASTRHLSISWARSIQLMPPPHLLQIQLNIILPSIPGSSKRPLSLRFPHQNPIYTSPLPHTCYILRPSNSSIWSHE